MRHVKGSELGLVKVSVFGEPFRLLRLVSLVLLSSGLCILVSCHNALNFELPPLLTSALDDPTSTLYHDAINSRRRGRSALRSSISAPSADTVVGATSGM